LSLQHSSFYSFLEGEQTSVRSVVTLVISSVFFIDNDNINDENDNFLKILVDETKTKTKIETRDENKIKINGILILTKISHTKLGT